MKEDLTETADAVLHTPVPCMFTEEELDRIIEDAEKEGYASQKEMAMLFSRFERKKL